MKMTNTKEMNFLRNLIFLPVLILLTHACIKTPDESKLQKLKDASESHKRMISQELDNRTIQDPQVKKEESVSMTTMNTGDEEPAWANEFPDECGKTYFCGMSFRGGEDSDLCPNKNSCREANEASARNDLTNRIGTRIYSDTRKYLYSERDDENENTFQQFQSSIRQRAVPVVLKDVRFRHFYWTTEKQLITLAMMKKPKEAKEEEKKISPKELPNLYLAFTFFEENEDFNKNELKEITQLRLTEILSKKKFKLLEKGIIKDISLGDSGSVNEHAESVLKEHPESVFLLLSIKGDISNNSSSLYPGLTRIFLNFSAYRERSEIFWKKTYEAKRPDIKDPSEMSSEDRKDNYIKTMRKGLKEIRKKDLFNELIKSL